MLVNPVKESEANRKGIGYVVHRMSWYWNLAALLLKENIDEESAGLRRELEGRLVNLYSALLSYQMKSVYTYNRNRGLVFLRDMFRLDGWDGNLNAIKDAEKVFRQDSDEYKTLVILSHFGKFDYYAKNQEARRMAEEDKSCMKDLRLTHPGDDIKHLEEDKDDLLTGSYEWIFSRQDFMEWRDGDKTQLLWIKGDPGKGKTMLLMGIAKGLLTSTRGSGLLSYFFCHATNPNYSTATAVLRSLIDQMIAQQRSLISIVRERYDLEGQDLFKGPNAFIALSEIFTKMLQSPTIKKIYLVVDALDECETELLQLLKYIRTMSSPHPSHARVRWLVSSRHRIANIEEQLRLVKGRAELDLERDAQKNISSAVNAYINRKVSELAELKQYESEVQETLMRYLQEKADGTYLWVALVCKQLAGLKTPPTDTLSVLETIFPPELPPFYQRMLKNMDDLKGEGLTFQICRQTLAVATLAYRPIHLEELVSIAGLPEKDRQSLENYVGLCGSFLIIRKGFIDFVHQSAKDYLTTQADSEIFPCGRAEVHCEIVSRSLQIMTEKLQRDIYNLRDPGCSMYQIKSVGSDPLARLRYICRYWLRHIQQLDAYQREAVGLCDNGQVHVFLREHLLHWLEALSLTGGISNGAVMLTILESMLPVSNSSTLPYY
jgi:hypothetical protein